MPLFKKLFFTLPTALCFILFLTYLKPFLESPNLILEFSSSNLVSTLLLSLSLLLSSLFFIIFSSLAFSWKIVAPVSFLISLTPWLFFSSPLNISLFLGSFLSFLIIFLLLQAPLLSYLTFKPTEILLPAIKNLVTLLIITATIGCYLTSKDSLKAGFKLPDSLIDQVLNLSTPQTETEQVAVSLPQISPEQIRELKQNPSLLAQFGLDSAKLDELVRGSVKQSSNSIYKSLIQKQIDTLLAPYQAYLPLILAGLFFITFKSLTSLLSLILSPLLWLIFTVLDKSGFTSYQTEMREVKKLIV